MVGDHCPTVEKIVQEFYTNLHQRCGDSFLTYVKGKVIEVTPTLISNITGVPCIRNPIYPWPVDQLPFCADIVECFTKRHPHQMETKGEGNFQLSDLSNDVQCIYNILTSWVHPVLSHTMITIERARCLYALLTEACIDFSFLVTAMMMSVQLIDQGITLPYGALITWIAEHARVYIKGMREFHPKKGPIGARSLNASNAHL